MSTINDIRSWAKQIENEKFRPIDVNSIKGDQFYFFTENMSAKRIKLYSTKRSTEMIEGSNWSTWNKDIFANIAYQIYSDMIHFFVNLTFL